MKDFVEQHSGELTVLILTGMIVLAVLIIIPQLLRAQQKIWDILHTENMKALEKGLPIERPDLRTSAAGRTAYLVPIFVMCTAGVVTCFLVAYRPDSLFSTSLTIWIVAGVVSLAASTGGVTLLGRLASLHAGLPDEEMEDGRGERAQESFSRRK